LIESTAQRELNPRATADASVFRCGVDALQQVVVPRTLDLSMFGDDLPASGHKAPHSLVLAVQPQAALSLLVRRYPVIGNKSCHAQRSLQGGK
jgi:hypothetical protein